MSTWGAEFATCVKTKAVSFPVFWPKYHHYGEQRYGL